MTYSCITVSSFVLKRFCKIQRNNIYEKCMMKTLPSSKMCFIRWMDLSIWGYHRMNSTWFQNTQRFITTTMCSLTNSTIKKKKLDPSRFGEGKGKKVVEVDKLMTVTQLAQAMGVERDHIYDAMELRSDTKEFKSNTILNLDVIKDVIHKSDMLCTLRHRENIVQKKSLDAIRQPAADPSLLKHRPPVVTIMGHVDHGKTTLLDYLRQTSVVQDEAGGITQHIGAFSVLMKNKQTITFLDTPGHAVFSAMRSRGTRVTDIVVLVIAVDDGVMEQTRECIHYANDAGVPLIVAINKCDKPCSDSEHIKRELLGHGILLEDFGGDVQAVEISALKGSNVDILGESILAQAEVMELKADVTGLVEAMVIESKVDRGKGSVASVIVQRGTLKKGSVLVAGKSWCKVRSLYNEHNKRLKEALPSTPVEVTGWKELPTAGELILEVHSEKRAKEVVEWRKEISKKEKLELEAIIIQTKTEEHQKAHTQKRKLNSLLSWRELRVQRVTERFSRTKENMTNNHPELNIVLKGDVDGSVEAILDALATYTSNQCSLDVLHCGVGIITDKDVEIANTFSGIVVGFNVSASSQAKIIASKLDIEIKKHSVIYKLIDDLKEELNSRLPPLEQTLVLGEATVIESFSVSVGKRRLNVAGCHVQRGNLNIRGQFKVIRNQETIHEGRLISLKHHKDDVKYVKKDMECGLSFKENLEFNNGDTIICYETSHIPQTINWDLGF